MPVGVRNKYLGFIVAYHPVMLTFFFESPPRPPLLVCPTIWLYDVHNWEESGRHHQHTRQHTIAAGAGNAMLDLSTSTWYILICFNDYNTLVFQALTWD